MLPSPLLRIQLLLAVNAARRTLLKRPSTIPLLVRRTNHCSFHPATLAVNPLWIMMSNGRKGACQRQNGATKFTRAEGTTLDEYTRLFDKPYRVLNSGRRGGPGSSRCFVDSDLRESVIVPCSCVLPTCPALSGGTLAFLSCLQHRPILLQTHAHTQKVVQQHTGVEQGKENGPGLEVWSLRLFTWQSRMATWCSGGLVLVPSHGLRSKIPLIIPDCFSIRPSHLIELLSCACVCVWSVRVVVSSAVCLFV